MALISGITARRLFAVFRQHKFPLLLCLALSIVNRFSALVLPASLAFLLNNVFVKGELNRLPQLIAAVIGATLLQTCSRFVMDQTLGRIGQRSIAALRTQVQAHVGYLPLPFFDHNTSGNLSVRIMKDVGGLRDFLGGNAVETLLSLLTGVIVSVSLFAMDWRMGSCAMVLLLASAGVLHSLSHGARPHFRKVAQIDAQLTGRLTETLSGVRVIKSYAAEEREALLFQEGAEELAEFGYAAQRVMGRVTLGSAMVQSLALPFVIWLGISELRHGRLTLGGLVAFLALLSYAVTAARQLGSFKSQWAEALVAIERTESLLQQLREDADPRRKKLLPRQNATLRFQNVSFAYDPGKPVLHNVDFEIVPGQVTALVGPSGSGKSTILSLICGFYPATGGTVQLDGVDVTTLRLLEHRQQLGVVLQPPFLFSGTIRENVLFGNPDATETGWREACRLAYVDEFAMQFAAGYETSVGERGVRLSGGQQQRICLARAILADPPLLLLDEPTSSLDADSEHVIQDCLQTLMKGRTTLVIAHRLSTIRRAEQILVLDHGRIVERGTHESLLALGGNYAALYLRQAHSPAL